MKRVREILYTFPYAAVLAAILCLLLSSCTKSNKESVDTPVYGVYQVLSGTYFASDSNGTTSEAVFNEDTQGNPILTVSQSKDTIDLLGCLGVLRGTGDPVVKCESNIYAYDPWFGLYVQEVSGTVIFTLSDKTASINIQIVSMLGDYSMVEDLNIVAIFNKEYTDAAEGNGST